MKILHFNTLPIIFITIFIVLSPTYILKSQNNSISVDLSEKIIKKIYNKYIPVYKKYSGVESNRSIDIIEYNPGSNTLINRYTVLLVRKNYFYKKPDIEVLQYIKSNTEQRPSDYQSREIEPPVPVLDENGMKSYTAVIMKYAKVLNTKCYQMKVVPRKKNSEHFDGFMYFRTDNLELLLMEGTFGDLPYSIKEYNMKLYYEHINDLPVMKSGSYIIRTYIPVLQPDRRYMFSIKVNNSKPLFH